MFQQPRMPLFRRRVYKASSFNHLSSKSDLRSGPTLLQSPHSVEFNIFTKNKTVSRLGEDKIHTLGQPDPEQGDGGRRAYNIIAEATCHDKYDRVIHSGGVAWKESIGVGLLLGPNDETTEVLGEVLDWECLVKLLKYGAVLSMEPVKEECASASGTLLCPSPGTYLPLRPRLEVWRACSKVNYYMYHRISFFRADVRSRPPFLPLPLHCVFGILWSPNRGASSSSYR